MAKLTQHQFEKSQEIFARITRIDGLLEKLNDKSSQLVDGSGYFSGIRFNFESDATKEEMVGKGGMPDFGGDFIDKLMDSGIIKAKKEEVFSITIDEGIAYDMLSMIIKSKSADRKKLVGELAEMGIEV